jgi:gamma-glutamyltranspeptidase/glutathione hydrolase
LLEIAIILTAFGLDACSGENAGPIGMLLQPDFQGGVVTDEPRAALVGRDIFAAGGNAVDAAVAAYFTLSVTMPSTAGLGGGGVCLVNDPDKKAVDAFDFLPRAAKGGLVAIPGNVRGMAAINARYGKLPWAQLVAPAADLASNGSPISRALASEMQAAGSRLTEDPQMTAIFAHPDGSLLGESDNLRQVDLGATLQRIAVNGVNELYSGLLGQKLAEAAQSIGAPLTIEDMRAAKTVNYKPLEIAVGDHALLFPAPPSSGGILAAQMVEALDHGDAGDPVFRAKAVNALVADRESWMKPGGDALKPVADLLTEDHVRAALDAKATGDGFALKENPSATGLVAIDKDGLGIACDFTMNAPFGSARIAPGTGIILAPAPNADGAGFSALAPLMLANHHTGHLYFLAAGGGGVPAAVAEATIFDTVYRHEKPLDEAIQKGRLFADGAGTIYLEDAAAGGQSAIAAAGFKTMKTEPLAKIDAIFCPNSAPSSPDTCQLRNDFRGNGLVTTLNQK